MTGAVQTPSFPQPTTIRPATIPAQQPSYEYIPYVENLELYREGGLPLIRIGDSLHDNRFSITDKLGYGYDSTLWLASDRHSTNFVAIKALTVHASKESREASIMKHLEPYSRIRSLIDVFQLNDVNGTHTCLVLELALCSALDALKTSSRKPFQLDIARAMVADLVLAVKHLHDHGVVHGDLHPGNILLRSKDHNVFASCHDPTEDVPVVREDRLPNPPGVPDKVSSPVWFAVGADKVTLEHLPIILADFGSAFCPQTTKVVHAEALLSHYPPESIFMDDDCQDGLSFPSDIWGLACTIFYLMGNFSLFYPPHPFDFSSPDEVMSDYIHILGKLPTQWVAKWDKRISAVDRKHDDYEDLGMRFYRTIHMGRRRDGLDFPCEEETQAFLSMLKLMLQFDPTCRPTIDDVMKCQWMQDWVFKSRK